MKRLSSNPKPDNHDESAEMVNSGQIPFADNRDSKYRFQRESVLLNAPESSGIYGLFSALWVHIGEADNLRARLLEHLDGDNPCIVHYKPSSFAFELVSPIGRRRRHEELTRKLQPMCNGKTFAYRLRS
jgi:hypothetical protein